MIRIDEIYDNTFWPYFYNNTDLVCMYHFDPPGRTDPDSLMCTGQDDIADKYIVCFDQEPLIKELHYNTFDRLVQYHPGKKGILITSEFQSDAVDQLCQKYNLEPFYYFFHGWAALDWFRGYNRTFLITPLNQRRINKTFVSPNRILGGLRQHRVLMLYHFQKLGLMNNWISASRVCPAENQDIVNIGAQYQDRYPDITQVLDSMHLPRYFPGETETKMSSCWLDNFDLCAESLLYHVSETVYSGRRSHLTEKTFKPIALGMPFILSAPAGSLAYLKRYGFQTFDTVWDESYDSTLDDLARAEQVAEQLAQLDKLSLDQKQDMFKRCIPIIEHNWNWFYGTGFEQVLWQEMQQMLTDIKNYCND